MIVRRPWVAPRAGGYSPVPDGKPKPPPPKGRGSASTSGRLVIPSGLWVDQPRTPIGRAWRRWVIGPHRDRRLYREMIAAMCEPLDPDEPPRPGCIR